MQFIQENLETFLKTETNVAIVFGEDQFSQSVDEATGGQLSRVLASKSEDAQKSWIEIAAPSGMNCKSLFIVRLNDELKTVGAKLATLTDEPILAVGGNLEFAFGFALRAYKFEHYLSKETKIASLSLMVVDVNKSESEFEGYQAIVEGTHLTRDLVTEPSNILTTTEFAKRIEKLAALGVKVEILEESQLEKIGMRSLLAVGQGSEAPSKVAIMHWNGAKGDPLLLVGKGVVFDTGGISIKPAAGMEEMTMDMGGAATVVGTMHTIAKRKSKAHVIGIVGLVENMPDGKAQRPGDIVTSLKGDTIEVLNTDAEGRMVLADIIWYGQERFKPKAVIDLATLTGAILVALGHEKAGVFGSHDAFTKQFIDAASSEDEGAWHMPLGKVYDKMIDRKLADIGNTGGRFAGSITAAQFIKRFVKDETPWIHLDIAGVALRKTDDPFAPHGASGWGVRSLNRLIADHFET